MEAVKPSQCLVAPPHQCSLPFWLSALPSVPPQLRISGTASNAVVFSRKTATINALSVSIEPQ